LIAFVDISKSCGLKAASQPTLSLTGRKGLPDWLFTDFDRFGVSKTSTGPLLRFNAEAMVLSESLCGLVVDKHIFCLSVNEAHKKSQNLILARFSKSFNLARDNNVKALQHQPP
jgi:hypothetical protein